MAPNPVVVVEVMSSSSGSVDTGIKLAGYFRVPSIRHYLVIDVDGRSLIHHRRGDDGNITTSILASGRVSLDPPGISFEIDSLFEGV